MSCKEDRVEVNSLGGETIGGLGDGKMGLLSLVKEGEEAEIYFVFWET